MREFFVEERNIFKQFVYVDATGVLVFCCLNAVLLENALSLIKLKIYQKVAKLLFKSEPF